ncbi:MAG TPA: HAMP domain-containing sensor histidine kinase [Polyangiaceae bacterium]
MDLSPELPQRRSIPFLVVAPAVVILLGVAVAVVIGAQGVRDVRRQSDEAAELRARLLAQTLAERLRVASDADYGFVVERAAQRSGAECVVIRQDGSVVADAMLAPLPPARLVELIVRGQGEFVTKVGRTRFFAAALGRPRQNLSVVVFVDAPEQPYAVRSLVTSVGAFAVILIVVAALVALALARDVHADVQYVRERILQMAKEGVEASGRLIPVRTIDQVGQLTASFNLLVERFEAAERAYRQDLAGALAYDRDRSAFLSALSHELRTPLNAILGFTDVLLSEVDGPLSDEAHENLTVVRQSGQHLRSLIDDILDLSALESGELRLRRKDIDVFAIAEDVVKELRVTAEAKQLSMVLSGTTAVAFADPRRVRQILSNVVGNAIKFTSTGSVNVAVVRAGSLVRANVEDTGPGIAIDEHESIFEEYRQSGDLSVQRAGTGLGLAITRRLVEMHGGEIKLESALGVGSLFTITFPVDPPPGVTRSRSEAPPPSARNDDQGPLTVER